MRAYLTGFFFYDSEDSSEDLSSGEESLSSSLGSDAEGPYFPPNFRSRARRQ